MKSDYLCSVCLSGIPENSILSLNHEISMLRNIDREILSSSLPILISSHVGCEHSVVSRFVVGDNESIHVNCRLKDIETQLFGSEKYFKPDSILGRSQGQTVVLYGIESLTDSAQIRMASFLEDPLSEFGDEIPPEQYPKIIGIHADSTKKISSNLESKFLICLKIPSLKERPEDIVFFTTLFVDNCNKQKTEEKNYKRVDSQSYIALINYPWPGNLDELKKCIESSYERSETSFILFEDLPNEIRSFSDKSGLKENIQTFAKAKNDFVEKYFSRLLVLTNGNVTKVSQISRVGRPYLYKKFKESGLNLDLFRKI